MPVNTPSPKDTIPKTYTSKEAELLQKRKEVEEKFYLDSIQLGKALRKAMLYANKNKLKASYHYKFKMSTDDVSSEIITDLYFGNLFSNQKKHLLIKRISSVEVKFNIFLLEKNGFKQVCENEQAALAYVDYTIQDINGDNYKDFLVHCYPLSGCCRRDDYDAYLYLFKAGEFTLNYEFVKSNFLAQRKNNSWR